MTILLKTVEYTSVHSTKNPIIMCVMMAELDPGFEKKVKAMPNEELLRLFCRKGGIYDEEARVYQREILSRMSPDSTEKT